MYFLKWFLSKNFFNSEVPKPGGVELSKGQHFNLILLFSIFFVFKLSSVEILSNSSECVNMGTGALSKKADITILGTTALKLKPIRFMWPKEVLCAHRVTLKKKSYKKGHCSLCPLILFFSTQLELNFSSRMAFIFHSIHKLHRILWAPRCHRYLLHYTLLLHKSLHYGCAEINFSDKKIMCGAPFVESCLDKGEIRL